MEFIKKICLLILLFGIVIGISPNQIKAAPNTDGLVGYWKLDEGSADSCSGDEDACDVSGHGNNAVWNGSGGGDITSPTWISDPGNDISFTNPYGMSFDGTDDYLVSDSNSTLTGNATFSVSLWFYVPSSPTTTGSWGRFVDWGSAVSGQSAQISMYSSTTNQLFVGHWGTGQASSTTFTNDEWHHAVWVRTGGSDGWSGNKLYIDGSEVTLDIDVGGNTTPNVTAGPYYIGGGGTGNFRIENRLDDVRIYNRELSETEITALANGTHTSATWDGSSSTNTETAANWNINAVPDPYTLLTIPDVTNDPVATADVSAAGLTINSGGNLSLAGYDLTFNDSGSFSNNGTLTMQGGEDLSGFSNDTDSGTITYNGTGTYASGLVAGDTYNNITFDGSGTWTLDNNLDVNGDLTISQGSVTSGGNDIALAGNWSNSGTFTHGNGTVALDGTDQTISGSTTFYNLTKSVSNPRTLTFEAGETQTIVNTLTLGGQLGSLLSLRSSLGPTQWKFDPQGTRAFSYLDVKDSNNTNNTVIPYSSTFTYGSNLTNWTTTNGSESNSEVSSSGSSDSSRSTSPQTCENFTPVGDPDLFHIDTTSNQATLYFTPVSDTSMYYVSYSTNASAEEHGAEVALGSEGVQNFTVNNLSSNTKYFFKVRGQNGCKPGMWSNTRSASTITNQENQNALSIVSDDVQKILNPEKKIDIISSELTKNEVEEKTKEDTQQEGVKLDVVVKDTENQPIGGVQVTLHSKVQVAKTDENGIAHFENVEPGDHRVILTYEDYQGEEKLTVDGLDKEQVLTLQVELNSGIDKKLFFLVTGILGAVILILLFFIFKQKNKKK